MTTKALSSYVPGSSPPPRRGPGGPQHPPPQVGPGIQMAPGGQSGPNVRLPQPQLGPVYDGRQTNAAYNQNMAQAYAQSDPRASGKQYQRAGMSSSAGTDYMGATQAAGNLAAGRAAAEQSRMGDAYANANYQLDDDINRNRFGMALAGLQEQNAQNAWMNNMQSAQNAYGFMGDMFGNMTSAFGGGSGSSLLSGLL